ncbi:MAG: NADH-quinone oxidoreductase subunit J [Anaerolineaceae bacterium]
MSSMQIIFLFVAAVVLAAAVMVVSTRKMLHSAVWLILALFGVAILFALMQANFFAVVQVVIYIGAIAILVIFAIMMTSHVMEDVGPQVNRRWWLGILAALAVFGGLVTLLSSWKGFTTALPALPQLNITAELGKALVSPDGYLVPFEVSSILLLAALIGSIFVAMEKK